ncbi:Acyl-coenzyme A thioesterase-like protein [Hapsidospora chrysogenum ATCC 11550]|uniref:Acyl-coenzyme A thioesterase-like protein n=1 Tax=Hapsidospora chrysogenum (strain ATCC 11550 / CBS 779.69 / DSM 880 / IAM 14645 / JCM 23072 / IMI 49137) TaxID=857340 RepID=A0A086TGV8_HAPC1|nr:Acyl-coenzyme A thioesterase-like protein [Hapsidospora chrysogenum ATCC 11550]
MANLTSPVRCLIPALNLIPSGTPPDLYASSLAHFTSIPWTAALLRQPDIVPLILQCRNPGSPQHDQFFASTLASDRALPHMLSFFTRTDANVSDPATLVTKASTLYQLGAGLTGGPSILHGGMTMAMVDEAMGSLIEINSALGKDGAAFGSMSVTGALDIRFLRPIPTGTAVVATAWMEGVEGRKTRVRCEIRDEHGEELARCSSTWVATKAKF